MMKGICAIFLLMLAMLEYRFWLGGDSIFQVSNIHKKITQQEQENQNYIARNKEVRNWICQLKKSPIAIEEHARYELGMVRRGERFYQIVEPIE